MKSKLLQIVNIALQKAGFELLKYPHGFLKRRIELIKKFGVGTILDVGANAGQYAKLMRKIGYSGEIISFEPLSKAYSELQNEIGNDKHWVAKNLGLGDFDGEADINISQNSVSSSLLSIKAEHLTVAPQSKYIARETVQIKKLDSVFSGLHINNKPVFLKIDAQGFESRILRGASESLAKITGIQVEMSLAQLYEGEMTFEEIKKMIESEGFELYSVEPGFYNKQTGQLLQIDGIFFRNPSVNSDK